MWFFSEKSTKSDQNSATEKSVSLVDVRYFLLSVLIIFGLDENDRRHKHESFVCPHDYHLLSGCEGP
jgi:hypothetical protein